MKKNLLTILLLSATLSVFASNKNVVSPTSSRNNISIISPVNSSSRVKYVEGSGTGNIDLMNQNNIDVKLFPNPSTNFVNVTIGAEYVSKSSIIIFDVTGKKLLQSELNFNTTLINTTELNEGIYIFTIVNNSGKIFKSGKFEVVK